jgi:type IV secretion system protein TrbL
MDMCSVLPLSPACVAVGAASQLSGIASDTLLNAMADRFAQATRSVMDAVYEAIATTSTVDLHAAYVTKNAAALASVALIVVVGLFVVQVAGAALRREPGGLARAVTGAGLAVLGTAVAGAVVQALLLAVDAICDGIAGLAGTSIQQAARDLFVASQLGAIPTGASGGAVIVIIFGLLFIVGAVLTLGTLLVRQALIVVAVVVAPLALAGGTARITSGWVRRWVQVTLALVLSKLAVVIVFVVAVGMVGGAHGIGALLSGVILLLLAALAPWACFKVLDFAGTQLASEWHRATNGSTIGAANQARASVQSLMRTVAPVVGGGPARAAAGSATGGGAARGPVATTPTLVSTAWPAPASGPTTAPLPVTAGKEQSS